MQNPILTQLNNQNQNQLPIQQVKNLMQQVKMAANPQQALQALIGQNPQLAALLHTNSPQQVAQILAQQRGIDLDTLIKQLNA